MKSALLLLVATLTGCAMTSLPLSQQPKFFETTPEAEREVYLAIYSQMLKSATARQRQVGGPARFYLTMNDESAPSDLVEHFREKGYNVHPSSRFRVGSGVDLLVRDVKITGKSKASAYCAYRTSKLSGTWGPVELIHDGKTWRVTDQPLKDEKESIGTIYRTSGR